ncbi:DUF1697 domain-containing protein [Patescibacteria group bacterium]|nr:DUF1697 domain-containing protein [Patescibacteria group bacterium]
MRYIALLRGINVGGKSIIRMPILKAVMEKAGFQNVSTYIQSGNIIFDSKEKNITTIVQKIEKELILSFNIPVSVVVKSHLQLKEIVNNVPTDWKKTNGIRCYIAFVKEPTSEKDVEKEITLKEGVDFLKTSEGVLYMTTKLEGITKSGFSKLVSKKIYKKITIRNFNTVKKLLFLIEGKQN